MTMDWVQIYTGVFAGVWLATCYSCLPGETWGNKVVVVVAFLLILPPCLRVWGVL